MMSNGIMVLDEEDDGTREPSEEEVAEYAEFLGIDVEKEPDLLWIAKQGVSAPVPSPWKACTQNKDDIFYFNFETSESIWDHPLDEKFKALVVEHREKKHIRVKADSDFAQDTHGAPPNSHNAEILEQEDLVVGAATEQPLPPTSPGESVVQRWHDLCCRLAGLPPCGAQGTPDDRWARMVSGILNLDPAYDLLRSTREERPRERRRAEKARKQLFASESRDHMIPSEPWEDEGSVAYWRRVESKVQILSSTLAQLKSIREKQHDCLVLLGLVS